MPGGKTEESQIPLEKKIERQRENWKTMMLKRSLALLRLSYGL